ncbi:MAG: hypothetical protein QOJ84_754 [Bradyrhizobium sp.]|nr:hypothetical protein [Bradyrhizobium sp.]
MSLRVVSTATRVPSSWRSAKGIDRGAAVRRAGVAALLLPVVPRGLGFDQALEPIGERAAVFLRQALSRRFNRRPDPNVHCDLALFQLRLFHLVFLDKRSGG